MNKLKNTSLVYIDPINGWHYHMKECWMRGCAPISYETMTKLKGAFGTPYIPCACVLEYLEGRPIITKPTLGVNNK
jgi:hypothetical protein